MATPSNSTVHAPHTPCSQPTCVPVNPSSCRRKSLSNSRGSTERSKLRPFTVTEIVWSKTRVLFLYCPSVPGCPFAGPGQYTIPKHACQMTAVRWPGVDISYRVNVPAMPQYRRLPEWPLHWAVLQPAELRPGLLRLALRRR